MANAARARLRLGTLAVLCLGGITLAADDVRLPLVPPKEDRRISEGLTGLLRLGHMTQHPLDDEISRRAFDAFLDSLDPGKVYFTRDDVDRLSAYREKIDDMAREHDLSFAYETFHLFLDRISDRVALVDELLQDEPDFTLNETIVTDADALDYATSDAEIRERWRKRIKFDLLLEIADAPEAPEVEDDAAQEDDDITEDDATDDDATSEDEETPLDEARKTLERRYHSFEKRMKQTDRGRLLEIYLGAITTSYDPHTTYMAPRTLENFEISMRLELEGIGAALRSIDGYVTVSYLIPGGAADRDGRLQPEDRIVGVGQGKGGEIEDVVDWNLSDVVPMVRGKRGTVVRLEVLPADNGGKKVYDITRDKVELRDAEAFGKVFEQGSKGEGVPYKVGVIDLPSFYRDMSAAAMGASGFRSTTRDVRKILEGFREQGVDGVILDLRRNGGGSLTEAIDLTGLFIDKGPVVQVKNSFGQVKHYNDEVKGTAWDGPLVVLTSKLSASASEILAGAIQDYGRGIIVGDPATHGKGSVQTLLDIGEHVDSPGLMGALKITTQQFYRPTGESTQNRGVMADVEWPTFTQHMDVAESDLDYSLPFDRVPAVPFPRVAQAPANVVKDLQVRSRDRVAKNEEFQKRLERIQQYLERKERKELTLNEKKFLAEREATKSDEEDQEEALEDRRVAEPDIDLDFYMKEAIAIAIDYIRLLKSPKIAAEIP